MAVYPLCSRGTRGEHIKSPEQRWRAGEALEFRTFSRSTLPTSVSAWVTPGDTVLPGFRAVIQAFSVAWAEQCMGDTCPTCYAFHLSESRQTEMAAGRMTGSGTVGNRTRARVLRYCVPPPPARRCRHHAHTCSGTCHISLLGLPVRGAKSRSREEYSALSPESGKPLLPGKRGPKLKGIQGFTHLSP